MSIAKGTQLGQYEIIDVIGKGGMGEVYRARDMKLRRQVAIKVLADKLSGDTDHVNRLRREAQLLASFQHSNIAAIYSLEELGGRSFLVMELVSGETLAARIERAHGPVPLKEALQIAKQVARALEAAHEKEIMHRDLKPANIMLTKDGSLKVLDFGLAKVTSSSDSPTVSIAPTPSGVIVGTPSYMSPEQARGEAVDSRTDIWSFGVIFYELLTGRNPFAGRDIVEVLGKLDRDEPDFRLIPSAVGSLLQRCLQKDVGKRQGSIRDLRLELEAMLDPQRPSSSGLPPAREKLHVARLTLGIMVALLLVAGAIGLWRIFSGATDKSSSVNGIVRLSVSVPRNIRPAFTGFTADGNGLIMFGYPRRADGSEEPRGRIYTRRFDELDFKAISGTDAATSGFDKSPNGEWIVFAARVSEQSSLVQLKKIRVDGSAPPITITDWDEHWSSYMWLESGDFLVLDRMQFFRLPGGVGPPMPSISIDTGAIRGFPWFGKQLPGSRGLFLNLESYGPSGIQQDTWFLDPKTGKAKRLIEDAGGATYSPTHHVIFTRRELLMAAPFDLEKMNVTGEIMSLMDGIRYDPSGTNPSFELSSNGNLLYVPGGVIGTDRRLVTVDFAGNIKPFTEERHPYARVVRIAPDGRSAAVVIPTAKKGTYETFIAESDRPGLKQVLAIPNADCSPAVWSPDGQRLAFMRTARDDDDGIYVRNSDGSGVPQAVIKLPSPDGFFVPLSWTPDGSSLLAGKTAGTKTELFFVNVPNSGKLGTTRPFRPKTSNMPAARISRNGRLVAFSSDESGRFEIYVASYSPDGKVGDPMRVSRDTDVIDVASRLAWAGDSSRLFYSSNPNKLMSVTIETKPTLSASVPALVYSFDRLRINSAAWDILPDGRLLGVQMGDKEDEITEFRIVLNWFSDLRDRIAKVGVLRK